MDLMTATPKLTGDVQKDIKNLSNHVFQLEEHLRYQLRNLDVTNFNDLGLARYENGRMQVYAEAVEVHTKDLLVKIEETKNEVSSLEKDLKSETEKISKEITTIKANSDGLVVLVEKVSGDLETLGQETEGINGSLNDLSGRVGNAEADVVLLKAELKTTAEGISARVERTEQSVTTLTATAEDLQTSIVGISGRVETAEGDLEELQETAGNIQATITNISKDVTTLQTTATGLNARVESTEQSVTTLTNTATKLQNSIDDVSGQVTEVQNETEEVIATVSTVQKDVADLKVTAQGIQSTVSSHTTTINSHTSKLNAQGNKLSGLEGSVEDHETRLDNVATEIKNVKSSITQTASDIRLEVSESLTGIDTDLKRLKSGIEVNEDWIAKMLDDYDTMNSELALTSNSISAVVSAVGQNGAVTAASIVAAINDAGSEVKIAADHVTVDASSIDLNGYVTIKDLEKEGEVKIAAGNIKAGGRIQGVGFATGENAYGARIRIDGNSIKWGNLSQSNQWTVATIEKIYDTDGTARELNIESETGLSIRVNGGSLRIYNYDGSFWLFTPTHIMLRDKDGISVGMIKP